MRDPLGALARYGQAAKTMEYGPRIKDDAGKLETPPGHTEPQAVARPRPRRWDVFSKQGSWCCRNWPGARPKKEKQFESYNPSLLQTDGVQESFFR